VLHPQWLSDRFHASSRRRLEAIRHATVLDIGSGDSRHEGFLHPSNRLVRLDYPKTNQRYTARPEVFGSACQLPVRSESVDTVLLLEVLEHLPCPQAALGEIRRVTRPNGTLYLSVPFIYPAHDAPNDYQRYTLHGLRALLNQHSFRPIEEVQHGNSFVAGLQLINLGLLELVRDAGERRPLVSLLLAAAVYPLCLIVNILALPLVALRRPAAACLGYFVVAERV
jgi:SAM-dependent methyltransferase